MPVLGDHLLAVAVPAEDKGIAERAGPTHVGRPRQHTPEATAGLANGGLQWRLVCGWWGAF